MARHVPAGRARRVRLAFAVILLVVLLSACQTSPGGGGGTACVFDAPNSTFDLCTFSP